METTQEGMETGAMQWRAEPTRVDGTEVYHGKGKYRKRLMNLCRRCGPGKRWQRRGEWLDEDIAEYLVKAVTFYEANNPVEEII